MQEVRGMEVEEKIKAVLNELKLYFEAWGLEEEEYKDYIEVAKARLEEQEEKLAKWTVEDIEKAYFTGYDSWSTLRLEYPHESDEDLDLELCRPDWREIEEKYLREDPYRREMRLWDEVEKLLEELRKRGATVVKFYNANTSPLWEAGAEVWEAEELIPALQKLLEYDDIRDLVIIELNQEEEYPGYLFLDLDTGRNWFEEREES